VCLASQLRLQHARDIWVNTNHSHRVFFRQVEAFLVRKQPTSREMRALMPKVRNHHLNSKFRQDHKRHCLRPRPLLRGGPCVVLRDAAFAYLG